MINKILNATFGFRIKRKPIVIVHYPLGKSKDGKPHSEIAMELGKKIEKDGGVVTIPSILTDGNFKWSAELQTKETTINIGWFWLFSIGYGIYKMVI